MTRGFLTNTNKALFAILVVAFALRVVGLNYGLPMFFIGDEVSITGAALKMLELKTFVPAFYPEDFRLLYYPPLIAYLYLLFIIPVIAVKLILLAGDFGALKSSVTLDPTAIWLASRLATTLFGTLIVFLAFGIARKMFGKPAGLLAAALVAMSFLAVQLSHFARHWIPATFFTYLVIALAFIIYRHPERKAYLWAGLLAGIAFGASYITAIAVVVVVAAHLLAEGRISWRERLGDRDLVTFGGIFLAVAAVFAWLNYPELMRIVFGEDTGLGQAKSLSGMLSSLWGSAASFFNYEPVLVLGGVFGLLLLLVKHRRLFALFVSFPLIYWIVLYFFFHFEPRYNMLLVPWCAVLAAYALVQLRAAPFVPHWASAAAIVVAMAFPLAVSVYYDYLLIQPDTRQQARVWIEQHIPADAAVLMYASGLELTPNQASVQATLAQYPYLARTKERVLAGLPPERYPQPAYYLFNLKNLNSADAAKQLSQLGNGGFAYAVVEYFVGDPLPEALTERLRSTRELIRFPAGSEHSQTDDINGNFDVPVYHIFSLKNLGPNVVVYSFEPAFAR